jgi:hypothetical protein
MIGNLGGQKGGGPNQMLPSINTVPGMEQAKQASIAFGKNSE